VIQSQLYLWKEMDMTRVVTRKRMIGLPLMLMAIFLVGCTGSAAGSAGASVLATQVNPPTPETGSPYPAADPAEATPSSMPGMVVQLSPEPEIVHGTATIEPAPTKSSEPTASPTPDTRLKPEEWQSWPIIPEATNRAREIYQAGLALGNDPHHFSKVGDCQSIQEAFMGFYDIPTRYTLDADRQHLKATIDQFTGSFLRDGMAVHGGFTAASPLSPMLANPDTCQPGETPLECEFRVHKPVIVFIRMEVWWEGRSAETYERYMRRIIDYAIEKGAVPILATKADNVEGDHEINLTTARLAYEYDLPLWNFWLAAQELPNRGLRDTFHISYEGWNVLSYTGLEALDSVWHGVQQTQ